MGGPNGGWGRGHSLALTLTGVHPTGFRPPEPGALWQAREDPQEGHLRQGGAGAVVGLGRWGPTTGWGWGGGGLRPGGAGVVGPL